MFPIAARSGSSDLPRDAEFWMPKSNEITEEGFGFFRDTWRIVDVAPADARQLIEIERAIADVVSSLSHSLADFERLAEIAESGGIDDPANDITERERHVLGEVISDIPDLEGLELGVAGLTYALASRSDCPRR